jgi:DNA-binding beta-propeller fold protein YncE
LRKLVLIVALVLISACSGIQTSSLRITNTPIATGGAGAGNFDDIQIDQANHRLYAADRDRGIDVFDISTPTATFVQSITLPAPPNGLALAPDLGRLYAGTADGSVQVLDTTTQKLLPEIQTGGKEVDLLDYSASRHELYASYGAAGTLAIIDTSKNAIDTSKNAISGTVKIGYALEQPRFNPADGMLYVTSPDADALFKVDPATGAIKSKTNFGACQPTGLAINERADQALIACAGWTLGWDLRTGTAQTFNQASHGDVVRYDPAADRFFVASPGKINTSTVAIFGGSPLAYISSVTTGAGGKAAAYDETNKLVYTTDLRPNQVGVAAFQIPDGTPALSSLLSLAPLAILLPLIVVVLFIVGRQADPIKRPEPLLTLAEAKRVRLDRERAHNRGQA